MGRDLLIADGAVLVREGREFDGLASSNQGFSAPGALQRLGDLVRIVVALGVTELGEGHRSAFARDDRLDDGHAGAPRELTDDLGELAVHLLQGLVPVLHMLGRRGDEHVAVAQGAAEDADLVLGPKGASEEPVGMQALQPLALQGSSCGPSRGALRLAGIDQQDLHAPRLQEFEQGDPVAPSRCHGDGRDAAVEEPVGEGRKVGGAGAETTYGLGDAIWWHGDPVLGFADVDPCGVGIENLEWSSERWRLR